METVESWSMRGTTRQNWQWKIPTVTPATVPAAGSELEPAVESQIKSAIGSELKSALQGMFKPATQQPIQHPDQTAAALLFH